MNIGGFAPCSLCDFPGKIAAVVFFQGCNFRCPYCHNPELLAMQAPPDDAFSPDAILARLHRRKEVLDGVVLCGGEPTLQADLPAFVEEIRRMSMAVKLDTNGSRPSMIETLVTGGLLDYVAMDMKAPWERYHALAGETVSVDCLKTSINLLAESGIKHEFRTTFVPDLLSREDLEDIRALLPIGSLHRIQPFQERRES